MTILIALNFFTIGIAYGLILPDFIDSMKKRSQRKQVEKYYG